MEHRHGRLQKMLKNQLVKKSTIHGCTVISRQKVITQYTQGEECLFLAHVALEGKGKLTVPRYVVISGLDLHQYRRGHNVHGLAVSKFRIFPGIGR